MLKKYVNLSYCPDCIGKKLATVVFNEDESWYSQNQSVVVIDCACGYQYVKKGFNIKLQDRQTKLI